MRQGCFLTSHVSRLTTNDFNPKDLLCVICNAKTVIYAVADDPEDLLIHFKDPYLFFIGGGEFVIDEEACKLFFLAHAKGIEVIAGLPFAEDQRIFY